MIVADVDGQRARATHGARGSCPECQDPVYARMPDHAIPHWAHNPLPDGQRRDCSSDKGEMSEWHREWQWQCEDIENRVEVVRGNHRADLVNLADIVVEFQNSPIQPEDVASRERDWRRGTWVLNGTGDRDDGNPRVTIRRHPDQDPSDPYRSIQWGRAHLLMYRAKWPIWIDLGPLRGLVQVRNFDDGRGNGWLVSRDWFIKEVLNGTRVTLRTHKPRSSEPRQAKKRTGHARKWEDVNLDEYEVDCIRVGEEPVAPAALAPVQPLHPVPVQSVRPASPAVAFHAQRSGEIRVDSDDELEPPPLTVELPECCGEKPPGKAGVPIVAACALCPKSETYWRKR